MSESEPKSETVEGKDIANVEQPTETNKTDSEKIKTSEASGDAVNSEQNVTRAGAGAKKKVPATSGQQRRSAKGGKGTGGAASTASSGYKWETMKMMMNARVFATAVVHNGDLYVVGGSDDKGQPVDSLEHYNINKRKWINLANMPTKRAAPACACINDKIIVVGGVGTDQGPVDAVEVYNITEKKWIKKEPLMQPLLGLSWVVKGELLELLKASY